MENRTTDASLVAARGPKSRRENGLSAFGAKLKRLKDGRKIVRPVAKVTAA